MKTDVRLRPSWRILLFLEATLLQQARTILSQVNESTTPISSNQNSTFSPNSSLFSAPVGAITAFSTCAPCSVAVTETLLSFPVPVNETTETATATVIPYVTEYPDGTNVTSYSTYSDYNPTAALNNNFTAPSTTPLTWTTLGFTLTYPTTYLAYPSPEAGKNAILTEQGTSYCYVENFTLLTHLPSSSLLIVYNETLFGGTGTPAQTGIAQTGTAQTDTAAPPSNDAVSLALETTASAYMSLSSSLLSWLDTLPQLSAIVGGDPRRCSQTVGPFTGEASAATTVALTPPPPTAAFVHTSVAVLTSTGAAVTSSASSLPDQGQSPAGGASGAGAAQTGGSGESGGGGGGSTGAGSGGGSSGESGSGGSGSGSGGGGLGAVVGSAAAQFASTAAVTPAPVITVGASTFGVATGGAGGVVIGGGLATVPPNSAVAINGVSVSLEVSGSTTALVVGGSTVPLGGGATTDDLLVLGSQTYTESNGVFVIGGTTLTAGGEIVVGGTTVSLESGGSVAVVNGQTETLAVTTSGVNTGSVIMSGIGVTNSSSGASATHKSIAGTFHASGSVVAIIAGVVVALGAAL